MKNTLEDPPLQPPDRIELRESLAMLRDAIAVCPALPDAVLADLFGYGASVIARQRLRVERKRILIHEMEV